MPIPWRRLLIGTTLALILLATAAVLFVYIASERKLRARYPVPETTLAVPSDPAALAHGEHIVKAVATCTLCHGDDLGGAVYADMGSMGVVAGPNLTRGRGGIGGDLSVHDWVRAIRFGVRRDGTSLIAMPSEVFTNFSDEDLGAVVAFLQQLPPVDRDVPQTRFGFLGRALVATGRLNILVAPKTHYQPQPRVVAREPTPEYGRYLADVSGCHGCHGHGLSGGRVAGPPNLPPASNLTPAGIGEWSEADFLRAMREGRRPNGTALDEFMPWRTYARMADAELRALWRYLRSVPPKPFGNK
jgi:cytochrome c553